MEVILLILQSIVLFADSVTGKSGVICPNPLTVAEEGDNVTLRCYLDPEVSVVMKTVDWRRVDLGGVVYSYRHRKQNQDDQMLQYRNRATLNHGDLTRGNLSLHISSVDPSDSGPYRCFVPKMDLICFTNLTVVPKDQQNRTKRHESSTTGPPPEEGPESEDHDAVKTTFIWKTVLVGVFGVFGVFGVAVLSILWKCKVIRKGTKTDDSSTPRPAVKEVTRTDDGEDRMEMLPGPNEPKQNDLESNTQRAERDGDQEEPAATGLLKV